MDARGFHRRLVELAAKIDLGETWDNNGCMAAPMGAEKPPKINYPRLYISGKKKAVDLPEKGKAIVQYKVTGRSMNQRDGGEESHSADVEIQSIEPMGADEEKDKGPKEGEAAKLLEDLRPLVGLVGRARRLPLGNRSGRPTISFDDRSRNDMGQFLPTDTGGVDPNSMAAAYGVHPLPEPPAMNESHLARIKKFFAGRRQRAQ